LGHLKFIFWQTLNLRLFSKFVGLGFPFLITVLLALITDYTFQKIIPGYSIYFTIITVIFEFFIVLYLQDRLIQSIYGIPLKEFISSLKDKHPVTKKFGVSILSNFICGRFKPNHFISVENLSELLTRVELRDGIDLPVELYAVLLNESAEMKPTRLWATWDFALFPMNEVFEPNGEIKSEYLFYFRTLNRIYANIKNIDDKVRIFLFDDEQMKSDYMNHMGWKRLLELHKAWGFNNIYWCLKPTFRGIQISFSNAYMEDFVYYELKWLRHKWVIGKDTLSKIVSLSSTYSYVNDSRNLFIELKQKAVSIGL